MLDDARLLTQLVGLERRTARGGRDSIDHTPGAHDDLANAVAGLAAVAKRGGYDTSLSWVGGPEDFQRQGSSNTFCKLVASTAKGEDYKKRDGLQRHGAHGERFIE